MFLLAQKSFVHKILCGCRKPYDVVSVELREVGACIVAVIIVNVTT